MFIQGATFFTFAKFSRDYIFYLFRTLEEGTIGRKFKYFRHDIQVIFNLRLS